MGHEVVLGAVKRVRVVGFRQQHVNHLVDLVQGGVGRGSFSATTTSKSLACRAERSAHTVAAALFLFWFERLRKPYNLIEGST